MFDLLCEASFGIVESGLQGVTLIFGSVEILFQFLPECFAMGYPVRDYEDSSFVTGMDDFCHIICNQAVSPVIFRQRFDELGIIAPEVKIEFGRFLDEFRPDDRSAFRD